jgi:sensor histidine kinase YesM
MFTFEIKNSMLNVKQWIIRALRDTLIVMAIGLAISTIFAGFGLWTSLEAFKRVGLYSFVIGFSLWKGNEAIGYIIHHYYPWDKNPKRTLLLNLISTLLFSSFVIFAVNYFLFPLLYGHGIGKTPRLFFLIGIIQLFISLLITSIFYVKQFFLEWLKTSVNEEKLKQEAIQLRYDALKSNVNPHFLFNSLSVLTSLVDTDTQKAKQFIQQFSNIYRYVLEHRDSEIVPLSEEVSFIESFTNLHHIRHGENLQVSINVDDTTGYIIPLSLQILLENCFKHNIISEEKPLTVRVWRDNDYIVVQNNFQRRNTIHESGGVGLETISKRYEYISERRIEIIHTANHYTVKVPIIKTV